MQPAQQRFQRRGLLVLRTAVIVVELQRDLSTTSILISIAVTALISGITIGGKALGKTVAINECTGVVYRVARLMHTLHLYR